MKFSIGEKVSLQVPLPYLKTADSISMLRPPDLVSLDEVGLIIGIRPNDLLEWNSEEWISWFLLKDLRFWMMITSNYIRVY